jgi:hypothetical protein
LKQLLLVHTLVRMLDESRAHTLVRMPDASRAETKEAVFEQSMTTTIVMV